MEEVKASPVQGEVVERSETGGLVKEFTSQSLSQPEADSSLCTREPKTEEFREHICSLENQGRAMRQNFPEFDLRKELRDPMFARLTSPYVGLSVEDAYYAVHRKELQQATARAAAGGIARSIQAGMLRPRENSGSQAGSRASLDYSKASKQQREELKSAIRAAAAKGEKIYP